MNHEIYLEKMRSVLDLDAEATRDDIQDAAIRQMEADGMTVTLDEVPHNYRVRVKGPGCKTITSVSTSGYPVLGAFEKYLAWKEGRS